MIILRRIGLVSSALFFCICLVVLATFAGLYNIFNTPQPLETALDNSGVYEEVTPTILDQQAATSALPLKDVGVRTAFEQALPAEFYQRSSEQIINGTYSWMHGGTATPEFSIDITTVKNNFADNIAAYVQQRLDELEPCDRVMPPPASVEDVLSLTCMPPGITPVAIANTTREQALGSGLFFESDHVTAMTLKDGQGRLLTQQLAFLPGLYRVYIAALVLLPIAVVLLALSVIFLSAKRRTGVRRVAWVMSSMGLVGAVLSAVGTELLHMGIRLFGLPFSVAFETQDKIINAVEMLAIGARPWWLGFYAGYVLLGIVLFITLRLRRQKPSLKFG